MPVLAHTKHEQFAQSVAKGISATGAYISAGYSKAGAAASASRLMTHAKVSARVKDLKTATAANLVRVEIRKRSVRVQVGQNLVDRTVFAKLPRRPEPRRDVLARPVSRSQSSNQNPNPRGSPK
jgi:hypothetical protein